MESPTDRAVARHYGIWTTLAGFALGGGIIALMFALADGFT